MQDTIRAATDNPAFQLDRGQFDRFKALDPVERERREKMIQLLGPLYDEYADREDAEALKRKKEINDILHYIQFASDDDWKIIEMRESPDFIIEVKGERIGLELTGIYDQGVVAQVSKRGQVCARAEHDLREAHPEMTGLINVFFDSEKSKDVPARGMALELTNYLAAVMTGGQPEKPAFLLNVDIKPQAALQIALAENYFVKNIDTGVLDDLIAQKESKIDKYKENTGLSQIWLLVIIDGVSEKSAPVITPEMLPQRKFVFDKVIIYDSFKQIGIAYPPPDGRK
ncbi:MAG TPA: hypothetical protein VNS58_25620 [Puia sp.]|nr:hypothetical protein [Puia sp.]